MKPSDIAKLAASIAAGTLTYHAALDYLDGDGEVSLLDSLIATGAGVAGGSLGGKIASDLMDASGVSEAIDDLFDW